MKELLEDIKIRFIVGMAMLIIGMWLFLQKVYVASNIFNMGFNFLGIRVRSGILIIPLLAGLVWMFFKPKSKAAKIFSAAGLILVIVYAIGSVNIRVSHIPLFKWIVILLLIVIGAILAVSAILEKRKREKK